MATIGRTPCDDAWFRQYFLQVFGRPPEGDSELDRYATAGQSIAPAWADRGSGAEG